ncbi:hypothetical protein V3C99_009980, partial [Haemonchus contortus]|uniref:Gamma-glutamylputrescine oxidoreductase n=1 Tax=Haemonchus contortus TaxID=6289 RepID=A0A7I4YJT8_HAECO
YPRDHEGRLAINDCSGLYLCGNFIRLHSSRRLAR